MNTETTPRIHAVEKALAIGEVFIFSSFESSRPAAVSIFPSPGATVHVSLCTSLPARIRAGTERYTRAGVGTPAAAPGGTLSGAVTTPEGLVLEAPVTAVRFECDGGTAFVEIVQ